MKKAKVMIILCLCIGMIFARGQKAKKGKKEKEKPMPYEFEWKVSDPEAPEDGLFFEQKETIKEDTPERTEGEYKVWLPDGRLMVVSYYVDGDSGFVPTITFEDDYVPDFKR